MILQGSHVVVDCPICGRPLEMESELVSHQVACAHCCGVFTVYETDDGSLATVDDLQERTEQLLRTVANTDGQASNSPCQQRLPLISVEDKKGDLNHSQAPLPEEDEYEEELQPFSLLVEHRDEVFARLATDIAKFGMRVVRAKSATEALNLCDKYKPTLVVANIDLPGQSGWLLTAKLRLVDRDTCVWLYQSWPSNYGKDISRLLNVEAVLDYRGDLLSLSGTLVDLMDNRRESNGSTDDIDRTEEQTAA